MSDVRPGYKRTDVGVIPEDWRTETVSSAGAIQTGPFGTTLKASEYTRGDGVPVISVGEIQHGKIAVRPDTPKVSGATSSRLSRFILASGDVLFARKGSVERSALVRSHENGWFLGSDGIRFRARDAYDSKFLAYQFQTARIRHWLQENSVGTTMPSMNEVVLSKVSFPVPPTTEEQSIIASLLEEVDTLIDSLEALIAKKRDLQQAAMQDLLTGRCRLPGFDGEWQTRTIGSSASRIPNAIVGGPFGSDLVSADYVQSGIPVIRGQNMGGKYVGGDFVFVSDDKASNLSANCAKPGDLVFTQRGTLGQVSLVRGCIDNLYIISQSQMKVTLDPDRCVPEYYYYYFSSKVGQRQILDSAIQTGVPHTNLGILRAYRVPAPRDPDEQRAIAAVLSDMDDEIAALDAKLAKARAVKQGMMQVLLTGEVRLP